LTVLRRLLDTLLGRLGLVRRPSDESGPRPPIAPIIGVPDPTPFASKVVTRIEVPLRTIVTVALALFAIWLIVQIWQILLLIFLAFLLAVALLPAVRRFEGWGLPRAAAVGATFVLMLLVVVGFLGVVAPPLAEQATSFITNLPVYIENVEGLLADYPELRDYVDRLSQEGSGGGSIAVPLTQLLSFGAGVVAGLANTFFVLVLTFYLLLEGERTFTYVGRYLTPTLRYKLRRVFPAITRVVSGYVAGQLINSIAFGIFAFITLSIVGVPEPVLLAVLAAAFDAVPIIGVPVATIPAVVLALTVSVPAALTVLALYIAYQQFENYILIPRVFGNTLQITSLSILVGVLVGGQLLGVIGIIISLPLTAAIPAIERIWREDVPAEELGEVGNV